MSCVRDCHVGRNWISKVRSESNGSGLEYDMSGSSWLLWISVGFGLDFHASLRSVYGRQFSTEKEHIMICAAMISVADLQTLQPDCTALQPAPCSTEPVLDENNKVTYDSYIVRSLSGLNILFALSPLQFWSKIFESAGLTNWLSSSFCYFSIHNNLHNMLIMCIVHFVWSVYRRAAQVTYVLKWGL